MSSGLGTTGGSEGRHDPLLPQTDPSSAPSRPRESPEILIPQFFLTRIQQHVEKPSPPRLLPDYTHWRCLCPLPTCPGLKCPAWPPSRSLEFQDGGIPASGPAPGPVHIYAKASGLNCSPIFRDVVGGGGFLVLQSLPSPRDPPPPFRAFTPIRARPWREAPWKAWGRPNSGRGGPSRWRAGTRAAAIDPTHAGRGLRTGPCPPPSE